MAVLLVVPAHLDALHLRMVANVVGPTADFTRLPYVDAATGQDVNGELPYLSEIVLAQPFDDQSLQLKAGVHLHWALPDALTRAKQSDSETRFPAVPNRWLVTRSRDATVEGQWVIESDYLSDSGGAVNYPSIAAQMAAPSPRPYRYLGRRLPLSLWAPATDRSRYLTELTAVGYGEPTFAAFYPNCYSVFGFHDPDYVHGVPAGLRYEILGWYEDPKQDALAQFLAEQTDASAWRANIEQQLAWTVPGDAAAPERMVCYSRITFAPATNDANSALAQASAETGVVVGNTATEALAAHLGRTVDLGEGVSVDEVERLLEALAFADHLETKPIDVGATLRAARHANSFRALPAGTLWTVRLQQLTAASADDAARQDNVAIPHDLADLLNVLNRAQASYDRALHRLHSLREQLFADWYKYMLCVYPPDTGRESYPDPDEVRFFLQRGIAVIQATVAAAGVYPPQGEGDTLAHTLLRAHKAVDDALTRTNETLAPQAAYLLQETAAPQYYLPNEPVVLLTGDAATPSDRHGQDGALHPDGKLACYVVSSQAPGISSRDDLIDVYARVVKLFDTLQAPNIALNTWQQPPWHPLLLEWEVEFYPLRLGNNLDPANLSYSPNFISASYELAEHEVELALKPERYFPDRGANTFSGTTILSPVARPVLQGRILDYLEKHALAAYNALRPASTPQRAVEEFQRDPEPTLQWYRANGADGRLKTLIAVYDHLKLNDDSNLAQALGGFNDALLMRKVTRQLPIADPLGFERDRSFTEGEVRAALDGFAGRAPQPLNDFNPVRAGALRIRRLRVIDNFGVAFDVDVRKTTTTTQLRVEGHPDWVAMPPRLAQAARLNFRWLDADHEIEEMNILADSSPVCGWLVPNNLDDSIAVFSDAGLALGVLYALDDPHASGKAHWRPAPGSAVPAEIATIKNQHLRKVVGRLRDSGGSFVAALLVALDSALAAIDPADYAQHQSQALLMGRPVALVRAKLDLELMGRAAVHQDWNVLRLDMSRSTRETNDFPLVRFPIRLGEHHQLDDGLVGYWLENLSGELSEALYAVQSDPSDEPRIVTYAGNPITITQAINAPAQYLAMLVDPRGVVHATSGVLPSKAIGIPPEHYRDALQRMEISFFSAPVLTDGDQLDLPLPNEAGFVWSWLERAGAGWRELSTAPSVRRSDFVAAIDGGATVWDALVALGWLTPLDAETALVTPAEQRKPLGAAQAPLKARIEALLDQSAIDLPQTEAHFPAQPTAREGWLKLRPSPQKRGTH